MTADSSPEIKFVADKMLGRLVRWLRIIGQDVTYGAHLSGSGLIRAARKDHRLILTRDRRVGKRTHPPEYLLIRSDHFRDQLKQVVQTFNLDVSGKAFTRCVQCNRLLEPIAKETVKAQVPPYVFSTQEKFSFCRECQHIYWPATHLERMLDELRSLGLNVPGK
jgi:uncharacterized protein with PIN domain